MMKVLDLFSGIGGFSLGLERAGMETIAFCESNEWCVNNALNLNWEGMPVYGDVKKIIAKEFIELHGRPDIITAGIPCQPASIIGKRQGASDSRWLWPDTLRLVEQFRPKWFIAENPTGILTLDGGDRFGEILERLQEAGYGVWWETIPASAVGAGHRRERVFIIAYTERERLQGHSRNGEIERQEKPDRPATPKAVFPVINAERWWEDQSPVQIVVDGVSDPAFWKQAVIATGNAVIPLILETLGLAIMAVERDS